MGLVALEFLVRIEVRVGVSESDDKAHRNEIVLHVIEEGPAVGVRVQGPAGRVNDESRLVLFRFDLPEFLQTDAVYLRIRVRVQAITLHQLPAQMPAAALGEKDVLAVQLDPRLILVGRPAVASHAHVASGDAANAAFVVIEHFRGGKAGVDLDAQRFGLLPQPAAHVAQADDVVAVIPEAFGKEKTRHAERAGLGEKKEPVLAHRGLERGPEGLPVGEELPERARIHHGAGEDVCADLRALLDHAHAQFDRLLRRQLLQPDRPGESGRSSADHDHVELHRFACHASPFRIKA